MSRNNLDNFVAVHDQALLRGVGFFEHYDREQANQPFYDTLRRVIENPEFDEQAYDNDNFNNQQNNNNQNNNNQGNDGTNTIIIIKESSALAKGISLLTLLVSLFALTF